MWLYSQALTSRSSKRSISWRSSSGVQSLAMMFQRSTNNASSMLDILCSWCGAYLSFPIPPVETEKTDGPCTRVRSTAVSPQVSSAMRALAISGPQPVAYHQVEGGAVRAVVVVHLAQIDRPAVVGRSRRGRGRGRGHHALAAGRLDRVAHRQRHRLFRQLHRGLDSLGQAGVDVLAEASEDLGRRMRQEQFLGGGNSIGDHLGDGIDNRAGSARNPRRQAADDLSAKFLGPSHNALKDGIDQIVPI